MGSEMCIRDSLQANSEKFTAFELSNDPCIGRIQVSLAILAKVDRGSLRNQFCNINTVSQTVHTSICIVGLNRYTAISAQYHALRRWCVVFHRGEAILSALSTRVPHQRKKNCQDILECHLWSVSRALRARPLLVRVATAGHASLFLCPNDVAAFDRPESHAA